MMAPAPAVPVPTPLAPELAPQKFQGCGAFEPRARGMHTWEDSYICYRQRPKLSTKAPPLCMDSIYAIEHAPTPPPPPFSLISPP